jgi:hypothetical protein
MNFLSALMNEQRVTIEKCHVKPTHACLAARAANLPCNRATRPVDQRATAVTARAANARAAAAAARMAVEKCR